MSPKWMVRVGLAGALSVAAATGCSSDGSEDASSDRPTVTFASAPEGSTDLGLCAAYDVTEMKDLLGGEENFKQLPPSAIGAEGDPVTGEACAWERADPDGASRLLRIEVRDYGTDTEALATQFDELESATLEAEQVTNLGEAAFSSVSDETSLLQVRVEPFLLTLSSRSSGSLDPVEISDLVDLGSTGVEQLS